MFKIVAAWSNLNAYLLDGMMWSAISAQIIFILVNAPPTSVSAKAEKELQIPRLGHSDVNIRRDRANINSNFMNLQ